MNLPDLQLHMMGYLLDGAKEAHEGNAVTTASAQHQKHLQTIISDSSPAEGLQIYSHAYSARLTEVLGSDHDKLKTFLGTEEFTRLAALFVANNPSRVRSLRHYGSHFPEFLVTSDHRHAALAGELCAFERTLLDVYDAPFGEQPTAAALQTIAPDAWPGMTLQPHPGVRVFANHTGSIQMWQHCNRLAQQPKPVAHVPDVDEQQNESATQHWALWRDRDRVCQFRHLEPIEHMALQSMLIDTKTLATTAEALMPHVKAELLAPSLQQWLNQWLTDGLVQGISTA